jgi:hypothetical protein
MSLIDKVGALWRSLFGRRTQPALAEAIENVGVLRSQLPRPRRLTDAAAGMYLVIVVFLAVSGDCMHHFLS